MLLSSFWVFCWPLAVSTLMYVIFCKLNRILSSSSSVNCSGTETSFWILFLSSRRKQEPEQNKPAHFIGLMRYMYQSAADGVRLRGREETVVARCFHALSMATFDHAVGRLSAGWRAGQGDVIEGLLWSHESRKQPHLKSYSIDFLWVNSITCLGSRRQ